MTPAPARPTWPALLRRRENLPILLVLLASLGLDVVGLRWGLPNYMDWAIDSVAPYRVLQAAYSHFSNGWWDKYPPLHLALLAVLYAPYLAWLKLTGGLGQVSRIFPFGLANPLHSLGALIFLARLVSVLMALGIVFLVYRMGRELFGRAAGVLAALTLALSYPFVYYAHSANLDVPYLFWSMLAIHRFLRVLGRGATRDYVLFALFATLAVCTKDQAYGLFLLSPLPILWARWRERERSALAAEAAALLLDRRNLIALGVAGLVFALIHNLALNYAGFVEHVRFITGPGSENYRAFEPTLAGRVQLAVATFRFLADALTPPLLAFCLAGTAYCLRRAPGATLSLLLLAVSYYATFLNALLNVLPRFVLPIAIVLALFGGALLAHLWTARRGRAPIRGAIVAAFAYAALFPLQLDALFVGESRYGAERWLESHARPGDVVETFAPHALHNYYPRFPSRVKVRSSWLEHGEAWDARTPRREIVQMPNLYTGREAPEYIVLSSLWYGRFVEGPASSGEAATQLRRLLSGRMGYDLVAEFKTPTRVPIRELFINPRILIFARSPPSAVDRPRGGA